ncbi:hypothetical protein JM49_15140 [Pseudomonas chlororaphis subsp. aurantiaca]|nr:hypothetical protein JM49_15140 [Pseudomonas chlororaphis subsp. aurantiaca]
MLVNSSRNALALPDARQPAFQLRQAVNDSRGQLSELLARSVSRKALDQDQPLRWYLGLRARRFNSLLAELLAGQEHCTLLATRFQPAADLMAGDGFHPSPALYRILADDAAQVIRQRCNR